MGPEGRGGAGKGLLMGGLWAPHVERLGQPGAVGYLSMKPVYFCVDTDIHTVPLHVSPAWAIFCECGILDCRGRTEQEERLRKNRRAGGWGIDGQMEATEKDSVLMNNLGI